MVAHEPTPFHSAAGEGQAVERFVSEVVPVPPLPNMGREGEVRGQSQAQNVPSQTKEVRLRRASKYLWLHRETRKNER